MVQSTNQEVLYIDYLVLRWSKEIHTHQQIYTYLKYNILHHLFSIVLTNFTAEG